jgi:hypothetical protein
MTLGSGATLAAGMDEMDSVMVQLMLEIVTEAGK